MNDVAKSDRRIDRLFSTGEARLDRWRGLVLAADAWAARSDKAGRAAVEAALAELRPLEDYFGYPGPRLLRGLDDQIAQGDAGDVARLARRVFRALMSSSYRSEAADWEPGEEADDAASALRLPPTAPAEARRP